MVEGVPSHATHFQWGDPDLPQVCHPFDLIGRFSAVHCLNCQKRLDVHQPDADLPYRMLATCEACKSWHVVHCDPIEPRALITLLPEPFLNGEKAFD